MTITLNKKNINNRIVALLGAGAVLDFDFKEMGVNLPSTAMITEELSKISVQNVDGDKVFLIEELTRVLKEANFNTLNPINNPYAQFYKETPINFEIILHLLEELNTYNTIWKNEWYSSAVFPPMAAFMNAKINYDSIVYSRSIDAALRKIIQIITEYDDAFRKTGGVPWYCDFWKSNPGKWDVFNLNYDYTVEQCISEYEDGFDCRADKYGGHRFNPSKLMGNTRRSTIIHPHGSIFFGPRVMPQWSADEDYHDLRKYETLKQARYAQKFVINDTRNQARENIALGSILVGLRKTDKLIYFPNSIYHNYLTNTLLKNGRVLIVGYSFGDLYINNLLDKLHAIHQGNEKVVLVDKWIWTMHRPLDVYSYTLGRHEAAGGETAFICKYLGMSPIVTDHETFCNKWKELELDRPIYSSDGRLMLCVNGFKQACEYKQEIFDFLYSM